MNPYPYRQTEDDYYDALWETQQFPEDEEELDCPICLLCGGSGEGQADGTTCSMCKGKGCLKD